MWQPKGNIRTRLQISLEAVQPWRNIVHNTWGSSHMPPLSVLHSRSSLDFGFCRNSAPQTVRWVWVPLEQKRDEQRSPVDEKHFRETQRFWWEQKKEVWRVRKSVSRMRNGVDVGGKQALQGGQWVRIMGMEAYSPQELYIKSAKPK